MSSPQSATQAPLTIDEYRRLLSDLRSLECPSVQFIGGEPTLHPWLLDLLKLSASLEFKSIEVFSNLTRLTDDLLEVLAVNHVRVACSFYAAAPEIHGKITGRESSFNRTVNNIKRLLKRHIPLRVGVVLVEGVNDNRLDETIAFLRALGVESIGVDKVRKVGRACGAAELSSDLAARELCGNCTLGSVCIDPDGDVYPCIMARTWRLGSVRNMPLNAFVGSDAWSDLDLRLRDLISRGSIRVGTCEPDDRCSPGACHPQVGGPPDCTPRNQCMPYLYPER